MSLLVCFIGISNLVWLKHYELFPKRYPTYSVLALCYNSNEISIAYPVLQDHACLFDSFILDLSPLCTNTQSWEIASDS